MSVPGGDTTTPPDHFRCGPLPFGPPPSGYVPDKIEARITPRQSVALDRVLVGLDRSGATVAYASNQRGRVVTRADALRYVLEWLAEGQDAAAASAPPAPTEPPVTLDDATLGT